MSDLLESDRLLRIRAIIDECLQSRSRGIESVSHEQLIATHPELMPELAEHLRYLDLLAQVPEFAAWGEEIPAPQERFADGGEASQGDHAGPITVRCPTCHASLSVPLDSMDDAICCPACGSNFDLLDNHKRDDTPTRLDRNIGRFHSFPGSAWERTALEAPPPLHTRRSPYSSNQRRWSRAYATRLAEFRSPYS